MDMNLKQIEKIVNRYENGESYSHISKRLGIDHLELWRNMSIHGFNHAYLIDSIKDCRRLLKGTEDDKEFAKNYGAIVSYIQRYP